MKFGVKEDVVVVKEFVLRLSDDECSSLKHYGISTNRVTVEIMELLGGRNNG